MKSKTEKNSNISQLQNKLLICLRQAIDSYYKAIIVLLESNQEEEAFRKTEEYLSLLKKFKENFEFQSGQDKIFFEKSLSKIKKFKSFFRNENRKKSLIEQIFLLEKYK